MNIIITLPHNLWVQIMMGHKIYELRKKLPQKFQLKTSKCFVIIKGEHSLAGYFTIKEFRTIPAPKPCSFMLSLQLCVEPEWVDKYLDNTNTCVLWKIDKVYSYNIWEDARNIFPIKANPQSYIYTDIEPNLIARVWPRR